MIWFLFNLLWRSAVIVILATAATACVRKRPAELANLIWRAALVGILLLPVFSAFRPVFPIPTVSYKVDMSSLEVMRQADPQLERAVKASMSRPQSSDPVVSGPIPTRRSIDISLLTWEAVYALCAGVIALRWVVSRRRVLAALSSSKLVPEWSTESFSAFMANEHPAVGPLTFGARWSGWGFGPSSSRLRASVL